MTATSVAKSKKKKSRKALHLAAPKMKSRRRAREVTTAFHRLTHELDAVKKDKGLSKTVKDEKISEINKRIDAIGGRAAYQDASILSTSLHKTSKWVFQLLTRFNLRPAKKQPPLRVLEVGAINTQLLSCPWLNVRAIDLYSRHEKIEQRDFFTLEPSGEFEVIVSSMVLNCVPDAINRGKMLQMCYQHLQQKGIFFLMVPLLCLRNSKHMTYQRFCDILKAVGFHIKETKDSPKVSFFCLEKAETSKTLEISAQGKGEVLFPEKFLASGTKRNDFSVVI